MRPEPHIRCSEYATGELNPVQGGYRGLLWRKQWTVELDFASGEEADAFVERVKQEGLLPPFRHGLRMAPGPTNRVKKRKAR